MDNTIFKDRDVIIRKLQNNQPLDENELRFVENSLTVFLLYTETLAQSCGIKENTLGLSTAHFLLHPQG